MQYIFGILEANLIILQWFNLLALQFHLDYPQATVITQKALDHKKEL